MSITVDSNILLSLFAKDSLYRQSAAFLEKYSAHDYIINDCIYLELGVHFKSLALLDKSLDTLEVTLLEKHESSLPEMLKAWESYLRKKKFVCPACNRSISPECPKCHSPLSFRQRVLTDFLIGGFALANSDGIITHDPAYYKNYFPQLKILSLK